MSMIPPPGSTIGRAGVTPEPAATAPATTGGTTGARTPLVPSDAPADDAAPTTAEAVMAWPAGYHDDDSAPGAIGAKAVAALLGQGSRV
jgi:hypothetical protein